MIALWNWFWPWLLFALAGVWSLLDHLCRVGAVCVLLRAGWRNRNDPEGQ